MLEGTFCDNQKVYTGQKGELGLKISGINVMNMIINMILYVEYDMNICIKYRNIYNDKHKEIFHVVKSL